MTDAKCKPNDKAADNNQGSFVPFYNKNYCTSLGQARSFTQDMIKPYRKIVNRRKLV